MAGGSGEHYTGHQRPYRRGSAGQGTTTVEAYQPQYIEGSDMPEPDIPVRSYGCQYGCGNPYDVILIQVQDNSTLMLCIPCFIKTAIEIVDAMTGEVSPEVEAERAELNAMQQPEMRGSRVRRGRHNAPAGTDSEELIEAYDSQIADDELPDEFK